MLTNGTLIRISAREALIAGLIIGYAVFLGALVYVFGLSIYAPLAVVLFSPVTYWVYRHDKRAAQEGRWRTSERSLHLLSLLGGWPGALIAQNRLRHKSSKREFRIVFFATVFLNVTATSCIAVWPERTMSILAALVR